MTNRTLADIALAKIYFELLVAFAKDQPGENADLRRLGRQGQGRSP